MRKVLIILRLSPLKSTAHAPLPFTDVVSRRRRRLSYGCLIARLLKEVFFIIIILLCGVSDLPRDVRRPS